MANVVDEFGITVKTRDELVAYFTAAYQSIYGADINLASDTPDGQMMMIQIQAILDQEDLVVQVFNSFDPDNAVGVVLDQRVAINGIQRQAGTFTITDVQITVSQALNLYGKDQIAQPVFTVADDAGNEFELISTQTIGAAGTYTFSFQAKVPGRVLTVPNTITVPVTIVVGVTNINNPTTYSVLGINEEADFRLKIRRQQSVALASQGYYNSLLAALLNINGMESAFVYENTSGSTDGDGVPGHSIWVIVDGSAPAADIAQAIYSKRNAGCGMKGDQSYTITQDDGSPFTVYWDEVVAETLYIKFTASSLDGVNPPNIAAIRAGLVTSFVPGVYEQVNINDLATAVQAIDNNTLVTNAGFSTSPTGPFTDTLTPSSKDKRFAITEANIIIIPMLLSPSSAAVASLDNVQFTALGGFGSYTWTMDANPSGGSVDSNGLYTAGAGTGTDVVRATDSQGNFVTANIVVT